MLTTHRYNSALCHHIHTHTIVLLRVDLTDVAHELQLITGPGSLETENSNVLLSPSYLTYSSGDR